MQEKIEGQNVAAASMCFSGEASTETEKGDTWMKDVPIVSDAMGYKSSNGRRNILVFIKALYVKDMEHTLINPNQCQHLIA